MKVFYSETHRKHEPPFEVFDGGLRTPYLENPDRMDRILNALGNTDTAFASHHRTLQKAVHVYDAFQNNKLSRCLSDFVQELTLQLYQ